MKKDDLVIHVNPNANPTDIEDKLNFLSLSLKGSASGGKVIQVMRFSSLELCNVR